MFTLVTKRNIAKKNLIIYASITAFCIAFGLVYESFSHGVYSFFMAFNFVFPGILGLIPYLILYLSKTKKLPPIFSSYSYNAGVATVTFGSIFKGILDIYGTTRIMYTTIYFVVGIILLAVGLISYIVILILQSKNNSNN